MRKSTLMWLVLAGVASTLLFHTSQKVTDGRTTLARMNQNIQREEESLRVLQAEWSYLNQPERLEKLASQYLTLQPQKGRQFTELKDLKNIDPSDFVVTTQKTEPQADQHPTIAADEAPQDASLAPAPASADAAEDADISSTTDEETPPAEIAASPAEPVTKAENAFRSDMQRPKTAPQPDAEDASAEEAPAEDTGAEIAEEPVVTTPIAAGLAERPEEKKQKPAETTKIAPKPAAKPAPKAVAKPADKAPAKPASQPAAKPAEKTADKPSDKPRAFGDVMKGLGVQ